MNIQEFAALKVGDWVECAMRVISIGEIVAVDKFGVRVRWGMVSTSNAPSFFYSAQGTIWFHWNKVEPMTAELAQDLSKRAT